MPHKHKVKTVHIVPFTGPVRTPQIPEAHGNVCEVAECSCGAVRYTNINQLFIERGPWLLPNSNF